MKNKKEKVVRADYHDNGDKDNSLAGWAEVIRQQSEEMRKQEQQRKAKLNEKLAVIEGKGLEFGDRVLAIFDLYRERYMMSGEFCEKVFKWAAEQRGIGEEDY